MRGGYVYILTNRRNGALYTGVCADLATRMMQHRAGKGSRLRAQHGIDELVDVEAYEEIGGAITREKPIENWCRA